MNYDAFILLSSYLIFHFRNKFIIYLLQFPLSRHLNCLYYSTHFHTCFFILFPNLLSFPRSEITELIDIINLIRSKVLQSFIHILAIWIYRFLTKTISSFIKMTRAWAV